MKNSPNENKSKKLRLVLLLVATGIFFSAGVANIYVDTLKNNDVDSLLDALSSKEIAPAMYVASATSSVGPKKA